MALSPIPQAHVMHWKWSSKHKNCVFVNFRWL